MYVSPGNLTRGGLVGGAGVVAGSETGVLDANLSRTGAPIAALVIIGLALLVGGFLLLRARLQAEAEA